MFLGWNKVLRWAIVLEATTVRLGEANASRVREVAGRWNRAAWSSFTIYITKGASTFDEGSVVFKKKAKKEGINIIERHILAVFECKFEWENTQIISARFFLVYHFTSCGIVVEND